MFLWWQARLVAGAAVVGLVEAGGVGAEVWRERSAAYLRFNLFT